MLKKIQLVAVLLALSYTLIAQDTITIMQYNLLYYGKNIYDCNSTNNNIDNKNTQLQIILGYSQPDIFCVNEMDASTSDVNYLMDNALNINGVTHWAHATASGSFSINMLYYNSDKFSLNSQEYITASPRQTNVYHLTYLPESIDFTVFVAHLKAGSQSDDETDKANATQNVMNYISNRGAGNYLFMGDLNLYSSSSQAFQNLTSSFSSSLSFFDPINRIGNWSNNSSFSDVHTQATHTSGDCFVTGGMDDRFDFIMISESIKDASSDIAYVANSYETIGQDGNHFNSAVNSGANNSAPSNVIDALYEMSDHLPVSLKLAIGGPSVPETVFNKTFDDQDLTSGAWQQYSVTDDQRIWNIPTTTYGHNDSYCVKMSGYDYDNNVTVNNEDWLISPAFNATELHEEVLTFWTAGKYSGNDLQLYYSSDYSTGSVSSANWTEITGFNLSTSTDYTWESSGNIDLSNIMGENVRIAFKYTSSESSGSRTWQIDDILLQAQSTASINYVSKKSTINALKAYPNPTTGELNVSFFRNNLEDIQVQLYNTMGSNVYTNKLTDQVLGQFHTRINLQKLDLPKGIYLLKVNNSSIKIILK